MSTSRTQPTDRQHGDPFRTPFPRPTRLILAARSDVGPMRALNEDSLLVVDLAAGTNLQRGAFDASIESRAGFVLAVIDRSGGSASGGADFDAVVAHTIAGELSGAPLPDDGRACRERLRDAVSVAHRAVLDLVAHGPLRGAGATLTVAVVRGDRLHLAQLGDTRAYVRRAGRLEQLTRDDSLVNALRDEGRPEEEITEVAATHGNIVTKAIGVGVGEVQATVSTLELRAGDLLLLCTDGLHRMVDDEGIAQVLGAISAPALAAFALVKAATEAGGHDNDHGDRGARGVRGASVAGACVAATRPVLGRVERQKT